MPLARLLAAALLFCSLFAFTQEQQPGGFGFRLPGTGSTELNMQTITCLSSQTARSPMLLSPD
jgi:hypothetical protein